jgi:hypothetical protein
MYRRTLPHPLHAYVAASLASPSWGWFKRRPTQSCHTTNRRPAISTLHGAGAYTRRASPRHPGVESNRVASPSRHCFKRTASPINPQITNPNAPPTNPNPLHRAKNPRQQTQHILHTPAASVDEGPASTSNNSVDSPPSCSAELPRCSCASTRSTQKGVSYR